MEANQIILARGQAAPPSPEPAAPADVGLSAIFNRRKPKHIGAGLMSGAGNVVKGLTLGVGTLFAAPVVGGMNDGARGAIRGIGVGAVAAVALPIMGVVTGLGQVKNGAVNTVQAVQEVGKGTKYNEEKEVWEPKYRPLDEEYRAAQEAFNIYQEERASSNATRTGSPQPPRGAPVMDREYYEALQVDPSASANEIRKAYYKLAREWHPDKNPGDAEANARFQRIGEAYQVLGNPEAREQYDRFGKQATDHVDFIDHQLFFAILFGSEALTPFVGTLVLGSLMARGEDSGDRLDFSLSVDSRERDWRIIQLAVHLREFCQPHVSASLRKDHARARVWRADAQKQAEALCKESFGWQMIDAISFSYCNYASHYLAKTSRLPLGTVKYKFQKTEREVHTIFTAIRAVKSANDASKRAKRIQKKNNGALNENAVHAARESEEGMNQVLKVMLNVCIHDVLSTVRAAAQKYLNDPGTGPAERRVRAETLFELGKIFDAAASRRKEQAEQETPDRLQEAYVKMSQRMDERGAPRS